MAKNRRSSLTLKDVLLYSGISLLVAIVVIVLAKADVPKAKIMNGFGFIGFSVFTFWYFIEQNRSDWKRRGFWILVSATATVHLVICTRLLWSGNEVNGKIWLLLSLVELAVSIGLRRLVVSL